MNLFKKICTLAVCSLAAISANADSYRTIYVCTTDGQKIGVTIAPDLVMNFPDWNTLQFAYRVDPYQYPYDDKEGFSVSFDKIESLKMSSDYSSIETIDADLIVTPSVSDGVLRFAGIKSPVTAKVYTIDGQFLEQRVMQGEDELSLKSYGSGIYLVLINNVTYKFIVK